MSHRYVVTHLANLDAPKNRYEVGDPLSIGMQVPVVSDTARVLDVGQGAVTLLFEQASKNGRGPMFGDLLVVSTGDGYPFGYLRLLNDGLATAPDLNGHAGPYGTAPPDVRDTERGSIRLHNASDPEVFVDAGTTSQARLVALRILARCNQVDAANGRAAASIRYRAVRIGDSNRWTVLDTATDDLVTDGPQDNLHGWDGTKDEADTKADELNGPF